MGDKRERGMLRILTADRVNALAEAANAAPSADNHHVFRLDCLNDCLRLWPTDELSNAASTRRVLGLLSVGAVAENLMLRGTQLGVRLEPRWFAGQPGWAPLVDFTAYEASVARDELASAIEGRHTNRRLRFRDPRLTPTERQAISAQADSIPGTELVWLDSPEHRGKALHLVRLAEAERFRNAQLHRELFESIRFDVGWSASASEGLPPGALELPWFERTAFAQLRRWNVQRMANCLGLHRFVGWRGAGLPCRLAPHLCAIAATGDIEAAAVNAGRALQRVWLQATTLGLAFQVFAASSVYALSGSTGINTDLRRWLAKGWQALCTSGRPFVVFRMGVAKLPSVRSERRNAQDLFLPHHGGASM